MIKKTLLHSFKILKISTFIGMIVALMAVALAVFFLAFPHFLKTPIETQLSAFSGLKIELNDISFNFENQSLSLQVHQIQASTVVSNQPVLLIDTLKWRLNLLHLMRDIYQPSDVYIDVLHLWAGFGYDNIFKIKDIKLALQNLESWSFLRSLRIDKTLIKNSSTFQLKPMVIEIAATHLSATIEDQNLNFKSKHFKSENVDITATIDTEQIQNDAFLLMPLVIKNKHFSVNSRLKLLSKKGDNILQWNGHSEQIQAQHIATYLPSNNKIYHWLKQASKSSKFDDISFSTEFNLSKKLRLQTKLNAHLNATELLFHPDWESLKNVDADIQTDLTALNIKVNKTQLNGIELNNIRVQIEDMQTASNLLVTGKINTKSELLLPFLKRMPLQNTHKMLARFALTGDVEGDAALQLPFDNSPILLDVKLQTDNNHFNLLQSKFEVQNFNAKILYYDHKISVNGSGNIANQPFDIGFNTAAETDFDVRLTHKSSTLKIHLVPVENQSWRAKVTAKELTAELMIFQKSGQTLKVELQNMQANSLSALKGQWKINQNDLPNMDFSGKNIVINQQHLPDFKVNLHATENKLTISNLEIDGISVGDESLIFNGIWEKGKTTLNAKAKGKQLSRFLQKLNIKEKVKGGKFDFKIQLHCDCEPWNMTLRNISGVAFVNVDKGEFTNKDPNIGRILALLNIRAITERLKLNLGDVTNKGFTYNNINAQFIIGKSKAVIKEFQLDSSSSLIRLTGSSDLLQQTYDLTAKVRPAIADSVPIATYLAGGGLAGLGIWLADKALFDGRALNAIVDTVSEFQYKITGSWDKPKISKL